MESETGRFVATANVFRDSRLVHFLHGALSHTLWGVYLYTLAHGTFALASLNYPPCFVLYYLTFATPIYIHAHALKVKTKTWAPLLPLRKNEYPCR